MSTINTKRLKAKLNSKDFEKIFKALDIPIYSQGKTYWSLYTGCHHKNPYDGSPKLLYYPDTGAFQCLTQCACTMDIIGLVQRRLNLLGEKSSFVDSVNFILKTTGLELENVQRINKPNVCDWQSGLEKFVRFRMGASALQPYDGAILHQLSEIYPLDWYNEGISFETMAKYQIRYYEPSQCTVIPCFDREGNLVGIRGRFWAPEDIENGKYRPLSLLDGTTYKFPTNDVFFGINWNWANIERTGVVTLVEGEKSVMKADTWFGKDSNVLALYGSNLGIKRRNQLIKMGVKEVNLALDSDFHELGDAEYKSFETKMFNLGRLFNGYARVYVVYNNLGLDGYKCSPFDFDQVTFEKMWKSREEIT